MFFFHKKRVFNVFYFANVFLKFYGN